MRVCRIKGGNRILEMQSDARVGTLTVNAVIAGFAAEDVEELEVSPQEYRRLLADSESIDACRLRGWRAIKAERERRRFDGGVRVGEHWFLSTVIAANEYTVLALLSAGLDAATVLRADWRTMDGARVDMTAGLVKQILAGGFAQVAAIDDAAQAHRAALEGSEVPAAYDYTAGWPAVFGE